MSSISQTITSIFLAVSDVLIGRVKITDGTDVALVDSAGNLNVVTDAAKAIDDPVGSTDTAVPTLFQHKEDLVHLTTADGDYDIGTLDSLGQIHVNPEGHHTFDAMNSASGWSVFNDDAENLLTTKKHAIGTDALTFDKTDGLANTVLAIIDKTVSSTDLGDISPHDLIQTIFYVPALTFVDYVLVRLGTDDTNYNEWRIPDSSLTADTFEILIFSIGDVNHGAVTGNGWNPSAITYIAVGVAFDAPGDARTGIIFDSLSYHTNQHTSAELNAEVTSEVSSANVNLQKVGGSPTSKGAGTVGNGSQRVVLANNEALPPGTNAIGKLSANSGVDIGDIDIGGITAINAALPITGDEANDAPDAGNPIKIGGKGQAQFAAAERTSADNDRVNATFDRAGYQRTRGELNPLSAVISDALSGDNEIIGTPGANLRLAIYGYTMIADGTVLAAWESAAGGTALSGRMSFQAREGVSVAPGSMPLFVCAANQALNLELSAAVAMQGHVTYAIWNDA